MISKKYEKGFVLKVITHPFFEGWDMMTFVTVGLFGTALLVAGVDLSSELASEKDEMGYVIGVLQNSTSVSFNILDLQIGVPETGDFITSNYTVPIQNVCFDIPSNRSPPGL